MDRNIDDKEDSLQVLCSRYQKSIVNQIVAIGNNNKLEEHTKYLSFIRKLQCLERKGQAKRLYRTSLNASINPKYVALSYTWNHSGEEKQDFGAYSVKAWDGNYFETSTVRNCVFERILAYMDDAKVQVLWIDAHCIRQDTCDTATCTRHRSCVQKRTALQAMDLVYKKSHHPVALLGRPLLTEIDLKLLANVILGNFTDESGRQLLRGISEAKEALRLLHYITDDTWWKRAWTFQENYRGGTRMKLLIHHGPSLEQQKWRLRWIFGKIRGELCIKSRDFSQQATRLCLVLQGLKEYLSPEEKLWTENIIQAAGRYSDRLPKSSAMTPEIVADIATRGLTQPWDKLAILANCCQYSGRLNIKESRQEDLSLSISILAMCLLNGEILDNRDDNQKPAVELTVSKFLQQQMFQGFGAPRAFQGSLTFNKGCRLDWVKLTARGIETKGHIWELGPIIDTSDFPRRLPWIHEARGKLGLYERRRILQLQHELMDEGDYELLVSCIEKFLDTDAKATNRFASFTDEHLYYMATEVAAAIEDGQELRLGRIWDPQKGYSPYLAIFIPPIEYGSEYGSEDGSEDSSEDGIGYGGGDEVVDSSDGEVTDSSEGEIEDESEIEEIYVFTSAWFRDEGSEAYEANDLDRHVSLEVEIDEPLTKDSVPRLRTGIWRLGMCFFYDYELTDVVFPWPQALKDVKPPYQRGKHHTHQYDRTQYRSKRARW